jgi:hypothetical protein
VRYGPQLTAVEKTKKVTSTLKTGVAVLQVLASLAPRHTEVLQQLVTIQLENAGKSTPYAALKEVCMKKMITAKDETLRQVLNELSDHAIIDSEKDDGGNEFWYVQSNTSIRDIVHFKRSK